MLQRDAKKHFFDPVTERWVTKLLPGEFHVCPPEEMVVTTLGSCVAVCLRDAVSGIGGMNHFMLPHSTSGEWAGVSAATRYGNYAMEYLINALLKQGVQKRHLEAKIFGAGNVMCGNKGDVAGKNAAFALNYLQTENIRLAAQDLGGNCSRRVTFWPQTGQVMVKQIAMGAPETELTAQKENRYSKMLAELPLENEVILF